LCSLIAGSWRTTSTIERSLVGSEFAPPEVVGKADEASRSQVVGVLHLDQARGDLPVFSKQYWVLAIGTKQCAIGAMVVY
jgi:hypothetical protein